MNQILDILILHLNPIPFLVLHVVFKLTFQTLVFTPLGMLK